MSWRRYSRTLRWYSVFRGLWTQSSVGDIPVDMVLPVDTATSFLPDDLTTGGLKQHQGSMYLAQANNIYAPGVSGIITTRPGFTAVNSTAISSTDILTSIIHQGEIADTLLCTSSKVGGTHDIYNANNNPPTAVSGGTTFTIGQNNLVDSAHFHDGTNPGTIFVTRQRDLPQFVTGTPTRSNFTIAGTGLTSLKPKMLEIFAQRALYGDCNVDGTVYDDRVYWSDIRDGNLITDPTTQFLSFETTEKDRVRALRNISDICLVGKLNNVFSMVKTTSATTPFELQEEPSGRYKGPVSQHAMLEAEQRIFWLGQSNIHSFDQYFRIRDWADAIKPTILALNAARLEFAVAGYHIDNNLVVFSVSSANATTHDTVIAINIKTGALYLWTLARNAFGQRLVSGDNRLLGGGYIGKLYNEMTGTAGDLDDATAVIDADVFTPRLWVNAYGHKQKIPRVFLAVDPIGTESITVQYRLDDDTSWSTPFGSPYAVTGTDHKILVVPLNVYAERLQLRFRNNTLNDVYAIKAVGVPGIPLELLN